MDTAEIPLFQILVFYSEWFLTLVLDIAYQLVDNQNIVPRGGANSHLEKSAPTYKRSPHLASAKATTSTVTVTSPDYF